MTFALSKIIIIHKVIARIVRRVNINHLYLAKIGFAKHLQHLKVIPFDIEVLCVVEIHTLFATRAKGGCSAYIRLPHGLPLVRPSELVSLFAFANEFVAQFCLQLFKVNRKFKRAILSPPFSDAMREEFSNLPCVRANYIVALHG